MYLFTRAGRFAPGSVTEALTFVPEVTETVHRETGLEVHAWMASMSPAFGTTVWAMFVETLEELEAATDKLAVSDHYVALAEKGSRLFSGPVTDGLATVVHGEPGTSSPRPSYASVARARAANGAFSAAVAAGVEIAETATRITGDSTTFLVESTGAIGGCRWITAFADIASLERSEAALMADGTWLALLDRVGAAYAEGATQSVYRCVA